MHRRKAHRHPCASAWSGGHLYVRPQPAEAFLHAGAPVAGPATPTLTGRHPIRQAGGIHAAASIGNLELNDPVHKTGTQPHLATGW